MSEITIWTLDWVSEPPRGFVRDLRLRWACEEAGIPYRIETTPFGDRETNHLDRQPFGQVPFLDDGPVHLLTSASLARPRFAPDYLQTSGIDDIAVDGHVVGMAELVEIERGLDRVEHTLRIH